MPQQNRKFRPYTSKQDSFDSAVPVYACVSCWTKHDAPKHARCELCNYIAPAMKKIPGKRMDKTCPNCARPGLRNEHSKPFNCTGCGHTEFEFFHSTGEYAYFAQLVMLNNRGKITNLRRQVPFPINVGKDPKPLTTYVADFVFDQRMPDGTIATRVLDYKGSYEAIDPVFKLKKKLVERWYPKVTIEIVTGDKRR